MKKMRILKMLVTLAVILLGVTLLLGSSCQTKHKVDAIPVEQALLKYFDGGYVPYSLPGRGEIFKPGAIIRYQKGAEVLVRKREDCFPLEITSGERETPKYEGESTTEIKGALGLFLPKAAATEISSELQRDNVQELKLDFGTLVTEQIPEGIVKDHQNKLDFSQSCKNEYGLGHILILGTIGSKTVRYQFAESSGFEAGLEAASKLKMKIGGGATVKRSEDFKNTMEVVSDEITWIGYIAYNLKKEGVSSKGSGTEAELIIQKLPGKEALELKRRTE
jgi:hypothetical protein